MSLILMGLKKLDVGWVERKRKAQATPTRSVSPWDERGTQLLNVGCSVSETQPTILTGLCHKF